MSELFVELLRSRAPSNTKYDQIRAADEIERLEARVDQLEDAMHKIRNWCQAYPVDVFRPPTEAQVKASVEAMKAPGCASSEVMHGSWARHILSGIEGYTDVLKEQQNDG